MVTKKDGKEQEAVAAETTEEVAKEAAAVAEAPAAAEAPTPAVEAVAAPAAEASATASGDAAPPAAEAAMPVAAEPAPYWTPYTPQPEPAPDYSQYAQGQPQQGGYYTINTPQQPYYAPDAYAANAQQQPQQSYYDYSAAAAGAAPQQPYQQNAQIPPQQPYYYPQAQPVASKDRIAAGLLGIFLGWAGVHKFYLGYNAQGFIMLAVSIVGGIFTIGLAWGVIALIGLIEGIMYLTKSQGEFEHTYVLNKREWF